MREDVVADEDGLSPRMRLFIDHYVSNGWNGTQAAIAAGYTPGNGNKSATVTASKLLIHPNVKRALARAMESTHLTKEKVLSRIAEIANANIADFTDAQGVVEWDKVRAKGYLVKKRKVRTQTTEDGETVTDCELELHDSMRALDMAARHLGLLTERVDLTSGGEKVFVPLTVDPKLITG